MNALAWQTLKFRTHDWTLSCAFSFSLKVLLPHPHPLSITSVLKIQDLTSRLDLKINSFRSLLFYSSDFCWSPFAFNMRELSNLKNLVHPGTVYSTSSVDPNPSSNTSRALRRLRPHLSLERDDLTVPQLILTIHISIVRRSSHP